MVQPAPGRRPTVKDVAQVAGVSATTVSNFFQHPSRLSPGTSGRVHAAASTLGYRPNGAARALRRTLLRALGFVGDLRDRANIELLAGVESAAADHGWLVQIGDSDGSLAHERGLLEVLAAVAVAGVLLKSVDSVALDSSGETWQVGRRSVDELFDALRAGTRRQVVLTVAGPGSLT